jgi:GTP cyclohydrolase I
MARVLDIDDIRPNGSGPAAATTPAVDTARLARAVREILLAIGEDPDREGLLDTPQRVAKAYAELCRGMHEDVGEHLGRVFEHEGAVDDVIMVRNISFSSMCEHHLLPFNGKAHIAYVPGGDRVVGLSKLARTVDVFARRPQMQERLTAQIADALVTHLAPEGVYVVVESEHLCLRMRGAGKESAVMATSASRGVFQTDGAWRREVSALLLPR